MVGGIARKPRKFENNGHSDARLSLWYCSGCLGQPGDSSGRVVWFFSGRSKHGGVFLQRENKIKQETFCFALSCDVLRYIVHTKTVQYCCLQSMEWRDRNRMWRRIRRTDLYGSMDSTYGNNGIKRGKCDGLSKVAVMRSKELDPHQSSVQLRTRNWVSRHSLITAGQTNYVLSSDKCVCVMFDMIC